MSSDLSSSMWHNINALKSTGRRLIAADNKIAKVFHCSPSVATHTRHVTTQKGIRCMTDHLCRRSRTKQVALRYNQLGGRHGQFYSDTMFSSLKSIHGNMMCQVFVNDIGICI
jgi:hypothetical protein